MAITDTRVQYPIVTHSPTLTDPAADIPRHVMITVRDPADVKYDIKVAIDDVRHHASAGYIAFTGLIVSGSPCLKGAVTGSINPDKPEESTINLDRVA